MCKCCMCGRLRPLLGRAPRQARANAAATGISRTAKDLMENIRCLSNFHLHHHSFSLTRRLFHSLARLTLVPLLRLIRLEKMNAIPSGLAPTIRRGACVAGFIVKSSITDGFVPFLNVPSFVPVKLEDLSPSHGTISIL